MANEYLVKGESLTAVADKIRELSGTTEPLTLDEMAEALDGIEVGVELPTLTNEGSASDLLSGKQLIDSDGNIVTGTFTIDDELTTQDSLITQIVSTLQNKANATPTLQTKTVTPTTAIQNVTPDSGYDGLSKVTVNAMPTATQATPTVSIDSAGKITASATQTAGYVSAGTKTGTKQLTTQAAKTITPSTSSQTAVASGRYTTGAVTVAGDANLKAENIAEGVSIFGVTGTHSGGSGGGGSVETCTVTVIGGNGITEQQNMQIIASAYENNVITTVNKTVDVFYYPEDGMGSTSVILNVINNTPVTLVFSKTAPSLPPGAITGEATFICNNENTISFTVMPDSSGLCNIILI